MNTLDILTIASYLALNIDIVLQILRIYKTKSSRDISLTGLTIRYVSILVILYKFVSLGDLPLIIGQGFITITFSMYAALATLYFLRVSRASRRTK